MDMAEPAPLDPLDALLDPIIPAEPTRTRTMATPEPTTRPIADDPQTPEVSTSAANTEAPSPSPTPGKWYCSVVSEQMANITSDLECGTHHLFSRCYHRRAFTFSHLVRGGIDYLFCSSFVKRGTIFNFDIYLGDPFVHFNHSILDINKYDPFVHFDFYIFNIHIASSRDGDQYHFSISAWSRHKFFSYHQKFISEQCSRKLDW
jgi:hypothetical protein